MTSSWNQVETETENIIFRVVISVQDIFYFDLLSFDWQTDFEVVHSMKSVRTHSTRIEMFETYFID